MDSLLAVGVGLLIWWVGIVATMYVVARFHIPGIEARDMRTMVSMTWPVAWLVLLGFFLFVRPVMIAEEKAVEQREFARGRSKREDER